MRAPVPPVISLTRATKSSSSVTITWSAPRASRRSSLAAVRVVAMDVPPWVLTIWIAARPTDELAAVMTTKSPVVTRPNGTSAP